MYLYIGFTSAYSPLPINILVSPPIVIHHISYVAHVHCVVTSYANRDDVVVVLVYNLSTLGWCVSRDLIRTKHHAHIQAGLTVKTFLTDVLLSSRRFMHIFLPNSHNFPSTYQNFCVRNFKSYSSFPIIHAKVHGSLFIAIIMRQNARPADIFQ